MRYCTRLYKELLPKHESGMALVLALLALTLVALLGLTLTMNATTEARISDNFVSHLRAVSAAQSGLEHARLLAPGLDFDALLRGPDGTYDHNPDYLGAARQFPFRLPLAPLAAQSLDLDAPATLTAALPDDGVINTGALAGLDGVALIPLTGVAQLAVDPRDGSQTLLSRYFVKVTDNNGEASELARDSADNPFTDGDGVIIVRSIGAAGTFTESTGEILRRNSVAIFESRLRRPAFLAPGPALTLIGSAVNAEFTGSPVISGGAAPAIGVLRGAPTAGPTPGAAGALATTPEQTLAAAIGALAENISGGGPDTPSVRDISGAVTADRLRASLLDARHLSEFLNHRVWRGAARIYEGDQSWTNPPDLGVYDPTRAWNDPDQEPVVSLVKGDLSAADLTGAGVLIVTGRLRLTGALDYRGLILALGAGAIALDCAGPGISGGVIVGKLITAGDEVTFGIPTVAIGNESQITANSALVNMAIRMLPVEQIGFREIAGSDP